MLQTDIQSIDFTNNTYNEKNTSITGRTFVADFGNNYWTFTIKTVPMTRADFTNKFFRSNSSGNGLFQSITGTNFSRINTEIQIPVFNNAAGSVSGSVSTVSTSSTDPAFNQELGSDTIGVTGGSGTIKAGDLIQFTGHKKVYMVTEDCNLDGSTVDVLKITPRLRNSVNGVAIKYDAVEFSAIPDGDVIEYQVGTEELYEFTVTYREVF